MHTFYLVRHGQKQPMIGEPELTELGHQQADKTGLYLRQFPIQRIFTSPSLRTRQTATHIAEHLQVPMETHTHLRERANWGDDPLQTFSEFLEMWHESSQNRHLQPAVGDSSFAAGQRMEEVMKQLQQTDVPDLHVVLVTHGGIIGDFLRNIFGDERLEQILKDMDQLHSYKISECSITTIQMDNETPTLHTLAFTGHLTTT